MICNFAFHAYETSILISNTYQHNYIITSLGPNDAYVRPQTRPSLVKIMVCRHLNQSCVIANLAVEDIFQWKLNKTNWFNKIYLKMSSEKVVVIFVGLSELIGITDHSCTYWNQQHHHKKDGIKEATHYSDAVRETTCQSTYLARLGVVFKEYHHNSSRRFSFVPSLHPIYQRPLGQRQFDIDQAQ